MEKLYVSDNKRYLMQGNKPFFWLGDTAWLLFHKTNVADAFAYLKNRAEKGYNVIQAVLVYATPQLEDINKMYIPNCDVQSEEYWQYCDKIIKRADELGMYMGLLPSWGSLVKHGVINEENAVEYADFLAERYKDYTNIIWILGGDIRAAGYEKIYDIFGNTFKRANPERLVTFHPFGRCSSSMWFQNAPWLDFNMFQSGHRRYDQANLGKWDDNKRAEGFFGEDNWKYVYADHEKQPLKPTLDAEPIYEWILQGLHDSTQPYWKAKDVRRYAYWSVFAGACGHTYGDNSVMQFYTGHPDDTGSYGAVCTWKEAMHHEGSGQLKHLKTLMESVDITTGRASDELLLDGQKEKYDRIAVFAGNDFIFAYNFTGRSFRLDTSKFKDADIWLFSPVSGVSSYAGKTDGDVYSFERAETPQDNGEIVVVIKL